jgi:hypothetical protein
MVPHLNCANKYAVSLNICKYILRIIFKSESQDRSVGIATGYGLDGRCSIFGRCKFFIASRPALGPTQPPTQRVLESLSVEVKRPEHEVDHSHPPSAEVNNVGAKPPFTPTSSGRSAQWSAGTTLPLIFNSELPFSHIFESLKVNGCWVQGFSGVTLALSQFFYLMTLCRNPQ